MGSRDKRVLVVDDEPDLRSFVRMIFESAGYAVEAASDGGEGLDMIDKGAPDLVVLDIMMPVMDGWEVLRRLKDRQAPPVVILSAYGDTAKARELGAAACLSKPFKVKELIATAEQILGH